MASVSVALVRACASARPATVGACPVTVSATRTSQALGNVGLIWTVT